MNDLTRNAPRISAAICTYNRYDLLETALASLRQQTISKGEYSILVVDNSPDPNKARAFVDKYDKVENIRCLYTSTAGLANARNIALDACDTELIAYLDDDAIASPGWLESLQNAFDLFGARAGAAGGPVDPIWQEDRPAWLPDDLLSALTVVDWGGSIRALCDGQWIAGANMAFRTHAVRDAGAFSTGLGRVGAGSVLLSNEEIEILAKLRSAGLRTIWAPGARVRHLVGRERLQQSWLRKRYAWQAVSDFVSSQGKSAIDFNASWQGLAHYFNALPPRLRTPRGLFVEVTDPDVFSMQVHANYSMTMLLLAGHHFPGLASEDGSSEIKVGKC
ncbi:MAG: glycosyltransferase [Candidatus Binataceae bacterium]